MKSKRLRNSMLLLLTATLWGGGFLAQSTGGDLVGAFTFNSIRSIIGGLVLLPVIVLMDRFQLSGRKPTTREEKKLLIFGGISCGTMLCIASNFQQLGINAGTSPGKAGFVTACYIIFVPILGIFLGKRCSWLIWVGVAVTIAGLYLLCMKESLTFQRSDILVLICAAGFALHIQVIDHFSPLVDGVRMSCIQFFVCGILTAIPMIFKEMGIASNGLGQWIGSLQSLDAWKAILYAGVVSCGVAYTLQIVGQEDVNPTIASMILSLESVFSVILSALLLNQIMTPRELCGCGLIFVAVVLAQLPTGKKKS